MISRRAMGCVERTIDSETKFPGSTLRKINSRVYPITSNNWNIPFPLAHLWALTELNPSYLKKTVAHYSLAVGSHTLVCDLNEHGAAMCAYTRSRWGYEGGYTCTAARNDWLWTLQVADIINEVKCRVYRSTEEIWFPDRCLCQTSTGDSTTKPTRQSTPRNIFIGLSMQH